MKKRLRYIDIARAIAIILVVCGHCDNFETWSIEKFSNLFFLPLFVFISGFLFKEDKINSIKELIKDVIKKVKKIYLVYLKWEVIFLLLRNIFFKISFYSETINYGGKIIKPIKSLSELLLNLLKIVLLMGREPFGGACWFLISLIFIIVMFSFVIYISRKFNHKELIVFIITMLIFITGCVMHYTVSIQRLSPSFTLLLFYYLGYLCKNNKDVVSFNNGLIAFSCLILLLALQNFGFVSLNNNSFSDPLFLIITSLSGIYMVFTLSIIIDKKFDKISDALAYIGQNSIIIVALHLIAFKGAMLLQLLIGDITISQLPILTGYNNSNFMYLIYVGCGVFLPLVYNKILLIWKNKEKI